MDDEQKRHYKLRHQMIIQSIKDKGDFDLEEINREIEQNERGAIQTCGAEGRGKTAGK